jgi:hypothetical protein
MCQAIAERMHGRTDELNDEVAEPIVEFVEWDALVEEEPVTG